MRLTEEQTKWLTENVPGRSWQETRALFIKAFGIEVAKYFPRAAMKRLGLRTGRDTRFKPGQPSPTTGKKMTPERYAKSAPTMFKKGSSPWNTDPVGTIKKLTDGYLWIKINNKPKAKKQENWQQLHRHLWEQANGPIPEGCILTFLDGNKENVDLDNLELIDKKINARMNGYKLRSGDKELARAGVRTMRLLSAIEEKEEK